MDQNVEAWVYPLFNPYGSFGWHKDLQRINNNADARVRHITRMDYTKYRIGVRSNDFNPLLYVRRLFQQWIVDFYVKIEKDRIQYCKDHQKELKADTYQGLQDYMENSANDMNGQVGKTIILPSTFIGSPRNIQQCYQDAMAIVNEKGKPDIFLTMTCNPNWPEIQENLLAGQQASDRPDLVARVFHLKKNRLIVLIVKDKIFGEVASYVYVIEFQKRGLPHMHLLITLARDYKIRHANLVDKFISAEIPDFNEKRLHEIVLKKMIHGPCGDWCFVEGKCSKNFPKDFNDETIMGKNGFPHYRRKKDGKSYDLPNGHKANNSWVVPYCPMLLQRFNCHINVEICTSIQSVKYLYKYIYKGHDAATITIGNNNGEKIINYDEIEDFIEGRYVGPVEAAYRILGKSLQDKSHTVYRLQVHLPNHQSVVISNNSLHPDTLNQSSSMLLEYFKLNAENENARQYFYREISTFFTFKKSKKDATTSKWETRQRQFNCIGLMYSVSPS